jgi:DNA-binding MarR family transcriptional regulator
VVNIFVYESPKLAELAKYLIHKEEEGDNVYLEKIKKDLGWSKPTIAKYLDKLREADYIEEEWREIPAAEASTWIKEIRIKEDKKREILEKIS